MAELFGSSDTGAASEEHVTVEMKTGPSSGGDFGDAIKQINGYKQSINEIK